MKTLRKLLRTSSGADQKEKHLTQFSFILPPVIQFCGVSHQP
jgi:hypothetical protein